MTEVAKLIADMVRAGVDPELIGRAAAALAEREPVRVIDEQAERRRAADRERKRLRNSAETAEVTEQVSPKKETSPTPPKEKTTPSQSEPNGSSKNRACRLPITFEPDIDWAVTAGMHLSQAQMEACQFVDYWTAKPGKDGTKLDWPATWRQWVRNQLKRRPASRASPPRQPNLADGFAAATHFAENRYDPRSDPSDESTRRAIPHLSRVSG